MSLRSKLYLGFLSFAFAGLIAGAALVERNVRAAAEADVEDRLSYEATMLAQMTANALFGEIDPTDTSLNSSIHALGRAVHTQLAIVAKNGAVVADSELDDPQSSARQDVQPEIEAAQHLGSGIALREGRIFVARPIMSDGRLLGFARGSVSMDVIGERVRDLRRRLAYGAALAALVAVILGYALSSRILKPMGALFAAAKHLGAGGLIRPIAVTSKDEIAAVSAAFNEMTGSLRETIAKLDARNRDMRLVLDNVSQGLLTLDRNALLSAERSAILDTWFGLAAPGTTFGDYIARADERAAGMFRCAWTELLQDDMPFEVALDQLPSKLTRGDRTYALQYTPLGEPSKQESFRGMLVVISDVTARIAAERAEGEQREIASAFERMARDRTSFVEFFEEADRLVAELSADVRPAAAAVRRKLHTLKGNASTFGLARFAAVCHRLEDRMGAGAEAADSRFAPAEAGDLSAPDRQELAAAWSRLAQRLRAMLGEHGDRSLEVDAQDCDELLHALVEGEPRHALARRIADLKLERADTRLQRFARQASDLAARLRETEVDVQVEAERIRLSRDALARFWTAFVHVVRNAVDHGVETPAERAQRGKPATPRLLLRAERIHDDLVLEVTDDGEGVDWDTVAKRAKVLGLPHGDRASLSDALFRDGVSTKSSVSEVSGRGMGLGAARYECERLGGTVAVLSERGLGTTFRFTFPAARVAGRGMEHADPEEAPAIPRTSRVV